jgi:hypothetical protein
MARNADEHILILEERSFFRSFPFYLSRPQRVHTKDILSVQYHIFAGKETFVIRCTDGSQRFMREPWWKC